MNQIRPSETQIEHPSLLALITWRMVGITVLFLAVIIGTLQTRFESVIDSLRRNALEATVRKVASHLSASTEGVLQFSEPFVGEVPSLHVFVVSDANGKPLFASKGVLQGFPLHEPVANERDPVTGIVAPTADIHFAIEPSPYGTTQFHVATLKTKIGNLTVFVQAAEDLLHPDHSTNDLVEVFFVRIGWLLIPAMLFLLAVNLMSIWIELHPLRRASEIVASIGPNSTNVRLPEAGLAAEIHPLIHAVNRAMERLDGGLRAQRQFSANVAHELRTPLAVLRAHVDTMTDRATAASLREDVEAMSRIVDQLLKMAQLDALAISAQERVDLRAIAIEVATWLAPLAIAQDKSVAVSGAQETVVVRGNRESLLLAVRNLVENGIAYTPAGTTVEVIVMAAPSISVLDRGTGVDPVDRPHVFERFWRRDSAGKGAGLGLAIVTQIAIAHGGSVTVDDAPGGGARFTLCLPVLSEPDAQIKK